MRISLRSLLKRLPSKGMYTPHRVPTRALCISEKIAHLSAAS